MKHFLYFITACLGIVMLFSACEKETDDTHPIPWHCPEGIEMTDEMTQWYFFKEGSYWTYENTTNGETHSYYVVQSVDTINSVGDHILLHNTISSNDNAIRSFQYEHNWYVKTSAICKSYGISWTTSFPTTEPLPSDQAYISECIPFVFPTPPDSSFFGIYFSDIGLLSTKDSLEINGTVFHDILEWEIEEHTGFQQHTMHFTIAKNVGIVAYEDITAGKQWVISDFAVIQ